MRVAVLASHNGTTLQSLIDAEASGKLNGEICLVISNNSASGAVERAKRHSIPFLHLSSVTHPVASDLDKAMETRLRDSAANIVFLAGYMKKLGPCTLAAYSGRILNTHPAMLPKFGGKGMYGMNVHRAVIESGETESGVTVHLVDENYDTGRILCQSIVPVLPGDTTERLADRVMLRERMFIVEALNSIADGRIVLDGTIGEKDSDLNRLHRRSRRRHHI